MCELGRPHCSVFFCFFSGHVLLFSSVLLMDTTAEAGHLQRVTKEMWFGFILLCVLGTGSTISQGSLRSRGKDPHGVCEGIIHLLGLPFTPKDAAGDAGGVHTACRSCPCWDGNTGWANICTGEAMPQLRLQLQRGAFVQEGAGICRLEGSVSNAAVICYMPDCRHSWGSFPERE